MKKVQSSIFSLLMLSHLSSWRHLASQKRISITKPRPWKHWCLNTDNYHTKYQWFSHECEDHFVHLHPFIHLFVFSPIKNEQTLMPTYPTGCKGVVRSGNTCSSRGWFTIIFVATVMKSVPTVLDTKGKEREARRLHSITWQTGQENT